MQLQYADHLVFINQFLSLIGGPRINHCEIRIYVNSEFTYNMHITLLIQYVFFLVWYGI